MHFLIKNSIKEIKKNDRIKKQLSHKIFLVLDLVLIILAKNISILHSKYKTKNFIMGRYLKQN